MSEQPKVVLVTGATSGVGRAVAGELAGAGATVLLVARDPGRGAEARNEMASGQGRVELFMSDLSSMASVRELAGAVAETHPRLDGVVHSAAVFVPERTVTVDGLETMFATNHLAPFLLTNLLLANLRSSPSGRVLTVSAPSNTRLNFDDLQGERRFRGLNAFGASKAASLVFTHELARREATTGLIANAVHPGLVRTGLMRKAAPPLKAILWLMSRSPEHAVTTITPLVLSPSYDGVSGRFYHHGKEIKPPSSTTDPAVCRKLWDVSADLTGLADTSK